MEEALFERQSSWKLETCQKERAKVNEYMSFSQEVLVRRIGDDQQRIENEKDAEQGKTVQSTTECRRGNREGANIRQDWKNFESGINNHGGQSRTFCAIQE